jgi:hypothetical protein
MCKPHQVGPGSVSAFEGTEKMSRPPKSDGIVSVANKKFGEDEKPRQYAHKSDFRERVFKKIN